MDVADLTAVSTTRQELHDYAANRLGDHHEAEDVAQEALTRLVAHRTSVRAGQEGPWLGRVTRNLVIDTVRRRTRRAVPVEQVGDQLSTEDTPEERAVRREDLTLVLQALSDLPAGQADLLWEHLVLERGRAELAAEHGVSVTTMHKRMQRAQQALKQAFVARGGNAAVLTVLFPEAARRGLRLHWWSATPGPTAALAIAGAVAVVPLIVSALVPAREDADQSRLRRSPTVPVTAGLQPGARPPAPGAEPAFAADGQPRPTPTAGPTGPHRRHLAGVTLTRDKDTTCAITRGPGVCVGKGQGPTAGLDYMGVRNPLRDRCTSPASQACDFDPAVSVGHGDGLEERCQQAEPAAGAVIYCGRTDSEGRPPRRPEDRPSASPSPTARPDASTRAVVR